MSKLVPIPIETGTQVELMRLIWNECLPWMTKEYAPVSIPMQLTWWASLARDFQKFKAFLYQLDGETVGYSLIRWHHDGTIKPLFGIRKEARGKNLARQIIQHYLSVADGPLRGEVRSDHTAIVKLNEEAGWELLYEENGVRYLMHPNDKRPMPDYKGIAEYWGIG